MPLKEKANILLVDDKPENFLVLEGYLDDLNLNFIKAASGKEALGLTLEYDLALILLDVQMPLMDGFETAQLIRGVQKTKHIPIIFVTAISKERQFVFKGYEVGAVDYLFKPIDPDILRAKVRVFLDLYRKKKELEAEITAHKETGKKLALFRCLIDQSNDAIFVIDAEKGNFVDVNLKSCRSLGYSRQELLYRKVKDIDPFVRDSMPWQRVVEHTRKKGFMVLESEHERKDGTTFPIEVNAKIITHGKKKYMVAVARDITERKRAERSLRESEERLSLITLASNDAIWDCDLETGTVWWNETYDSLFGERPLATRYSWQWWINHLHPEDQDRVVDSIKSALLEGKDEFWTDEYRYQRADGTYAYVLDRAYIARNSSGKPHRILGTMLDLTEHKEMEKALKRSNEELEERVKERTAELKKTYNQLLHAEKLSAVGRLSASIAHEVNNPLFGIRSVLGGVKRRVPLDEEDEELVDMALQECDRIKHLIRDLKDFNRPTKGVVVEMDVHASLNSILLLLKKEFKNKKIKAAKQYASDMPVIQAVSDQIKQVLLNLLHNAADAMADSGGTITIITEVVDDQVAIHIQDTGAGIKPEDLNQIFEPFFTTKPEVKGTGLGLSVSYGIVKRHGGRIEVESTPGNGSVFTVFLPIIAQ